jgi:hypothetical protein
MAGQASHRLDLGAVLRRRLDQSQIPFAFGFLVSNIAK